MADDDRLHPITTTPTSDTNSFPPFAVAAATRQTQQSLVQVGGARFRSEEVGALTGKNINKVRTFQHCYRRCFLTNKKDDAEWAQDKNICGK